MTTNYIVVTMTTHTETTENRHKLTRITHYNLTTTDYNLLEKNK